MACQSEGGSQNGISGVRHRSGLNNARKGDRWRPEKGDNGDGGEVGAQRDKGSQESTHREKEARMPWRILKKFRLNFGT